MKQPLALLLNDIHISKDNIPEFKKNWQEALDICKENNISSLILGGDMFTTRASQTLATLLAVKEALKQADGQGLLITLAPGNHDKTDPEAIESFLHLYHGLPHIYVVDDHDIQYWEGCDFVLIIMGYFPENGSFLLRLDEAVKTAFEDFPDVVKSKSDIILYIHEGIHGALGNFEIPGELPQEPFLNFKKVLCGHYHNRIRIKNTPIEYIGSSRQHNFGEDENKGYTILFDNGTTQFIQNEVNARYVTYEAMADELESLSLDEDPLYKYKIKVNCNVNQTKLFDKQKLLEMGFDKVELIAETLVSKEVVATGISEKYDKLGIRKEYENYCQENSIDNRLGLKYLEG